MSSVHLLANSMLRSSITGLKNTCPEEKGKGNISNHPLRGTDTFVSRCLPTHLVFFFFFFLLCFSLFSFVFYILKYRDPHSYSLCLTETGIFFNLLTQHLSACYSKHPSDLRVCGGRAEMTLLGPPPHLAHTSTLLITAPYEWIEQDYQGWPGLASRVEITF